jgi:hypothetical protein
VIITEFWEKSTDSLEQYFLGAQIDVSGIVKDCPGLEAHKRVLNQESLVEPQTPAQAAESIPRQTKFQTHQPDHEWTYQAQEWARPRAQQALRLSREAVSG